MWIRNLFAECLTDPTGKSFTLHLLCRNIPWEVILSTCLHFSVILRCKLLTQQSFACPLLDDENSLLVGDYQSPGGLSSALIWGWFYGTLLTGSVFIWAPQIMDLYVYWECPGSQSVIILLWRFACLTVRPMKIPPSCLFDLITMSAPCMVEGMTDTSFNNQSTFF